MEGKTVEGQTNESAERLRTRMRGLSMAFRSERVRWLIGRQNEIRESKGLSEVAFRELFNETVNEEAERAMIISEVTKVKEATIGDIAKATEIPTKKILKHMIALMKRGSVSITGERETEYTFTAINPVE